MITDFEIKYIMGLTEHLLIRNDPVRAIFWYHQLAQLDPKREKEYKETINDLKYTYDI